MTTSFQPCWFKNALQLHIPVIVDAVEPHLMGPLNSGHLLYNAYKNPDYPSLSSVLNSIDLFHKIVHHCTGVNNFKLD